MSRILRAQNARHLPVALSLSSGGNVKPYAVLALASFVACTSTRTAVEPLRTDTLESYVSVLTDHVSSRWVAPEPFNYEINCVVMISQDQTGTVKSAEVSDCNGSAEEIQAIQRAVETASPLPLPDNPLVFDAEIRLTFCPRC